MLVFLFYNKTKVKNMKEAQQNVFGTQDGQKYSISRIWFKTFTFLGSEKFGVSSSWDKLTLATEEGTKLVSALYSSLAFYKDRYKDEHGKIRRLFT